MSLPLFTFFNRSACQVFSAPFDVRLPILLDTVASTTVVQPDLCVICDESKLEERGCNGAPDLIIEILSPGNTKSEMRDRYKVYEEQAFENIGWYTH